jgi:stage II sporulation protein D
VRALILSFFSFAFAAHAAETMRIAMDVSGNQVEISSRDLAVGDDTEDGPFNACGSPASIRIVDGTLVVNGSAIAKTTVRFRGGIRNVNQGSELSNTEPIHIRHLTVRGDVVVRLERNNLRFINVIPLEDYLVAVLGSEMPHTFPPEALKAQAVAARTYALFKKIDAYDEPYHLGSSVLHQVYGGLGREASRTREAVRATFGEILTYGLAPIEAYFHASCGGQTESGESALNRPLPYLQPVECPCGKTPATRWELILRESELASFLGLRDVHSVSVTARSETGRVRRVAAYGRSWNGASFRERIGYGRLKSLSFDVRSEGEKVHFIGRGLGHGAGLCQWGAKIYAEEGWDYRRILAHYYPGTELQRLY